MVSTFANLKKQDREYDNFQEDNEALAHRTTNPVLNIVGGVYRSTATSYTDGDAVAFTFGSDGKLLVDTELTLNATSLTIDNVHSFATSITDNTTSGYALIDSLGHVQVDVMTLPGGATAYTDDSGEFVAAAGKGYAMMGLATSDSVDADDIGALRMTTSRNLGADISEQSLTAVKISKDSSANATSNRIWAASNVDQIAGNTTNTNGGNRDTGTQTTTLADDDPAVTALQIIDDWDATHDSAVTADGPQVMGQARSSQSTAVTNDDATRLVTNVYGELVVSGYDWSAQNVRMAETDPLSQHHVEETLASVSSQGTATTQYYFDMDGFRTFAVQIQDNPGAAGNNVYTFNASLQDDGTAPASVAYQDVTNAWFGATSFTATAFLERDTPVAVKYVRVTVARNNGAVAADGAWDLYLKKLY